MYVKYIPQIGEGGFREKQGEGCRGEPDVASPTNARRKSLAGVWAAFRGPGEEKKGDGGREDGAGQEEREMESD